MRIQPAYELRFEELHLSIYRGESCAFTQHRSISKRERVHELGYALAGELKLHESWDVIGVAETFDFNDITYKVLPKPWRRKYPPLWPRIDDPGTLQNSAVGKLDLYMVLLLVNQLGLSTQKQLRGCMVVDEPASLLVDPAGANHLVGILRSA